MAPKSPKGDFGECRGGGIKFMRSYAFRTLSYLVLKKKRPSATLPDGRLYSEIDLNDYFTITFVT
jgi:hypothetical protein